MATETSNPSRDGPMLLLRKEDFDEVLACAAERGAERPSPRGGRIGWPIG